MRRRHRLRQRVGRGVDPVKPITIDAAVTELQRIFDARPQSELELVFEGYHEAMTEELNRLRLAACDDPDHHPLRPCGVCEGCGRARGVIS